MIWDALLEFLLRLAFGLSLGMLCTPSSRVSPGFFRVHLWVLLGMYTLAALFSTNSGVRGQPQTVILAWCVGAAAISYLGAVVWLYERAAAGRAAIAVVATFGLAATLQSALVTSSGNEEHWVSGPPAVWAAADAVSASCLLGFTLASMLLGHWYLNSPGMQLGPLRGLIIAIAISVFIRAAVCGAGLALLIGSGHQATFAFWVVIALRWLAGIVGVGTLAGMTWQTLKIPNTQSATGILYVAVIFSFLGELAGQLVADVGPYPL